MTSLSYNKVLVLVVLAVCFVIIGVASTTGHAESESETLQRFDRIDGRSFHALQYQQGRCQACHSEQRPRGYPEDDACEACHSVEEVVASTARAAEDEIWQNPHNNLHWGTEVPCVECHGEHSAKEPICADCHTFDYPNHKY